MPHQTTLKAKRNVVLLALSQAVLITGTSLLLASCALVGMTLSSTKALATLPLALLFLAQMATTIPASLYMQRVGRRLGFMTSSVFGMAGAAIATVGVIKAEFIVFGTVTLTSFSSGAVQNILGWETINTAVIPFLLLIALANFWLRGKPGTKAETL